MRKISIFTLVLAVSMFFSACGGVMYYGKSISVKVPEKPKDEFKVGDLICLGWENTDSKTREKWVSRFYIYKDNSKVAEFFVRPESVGTRRFYLKELTKDGLVTRAQFETLPSYEMPATELYP
jgi:hypothetical protein